jgi:hypothetical protein
MGDERRTFVPAERAPVDLLVAALTFVAASVAFVLLGVSQRPAWSALLFVAVIVIAATIGGVTRWYRIEDAPTIAADATVLDAAPPPGWRHWLTTVGEVLLYPLIGLFVQALGLDHGGWTGLALAGAYLIAHGAAEVVLRATMRRRGVRYVRSQDGEKHAFQATLAEARPAPAGS